jgi:c-di-GMP-binding flagellar brake protein YcgR
MMSGEESRRRRYPRIPSSNTVLVKRLGDRPHEEFARTRTVGLGGCSFASKEPLGIGTYLQVFITIKHEVIEALARVVYENPRDDGQHDLGVEFLVINEADQKKISDLFPVDRE